MAPPPHDPGKWPRIINVGLRSSGMINGVPAPPRIITLSSQISAHAYSVFAPLFVIEPVLSSSPAKTLRYRRGGFKAYETFIRGPLLKRRACTQVSVHASVSLHFENYNLAE